MIDLIIRQARVVDSTHDSIADVAIDNGIFTNIAPIIDGTGKAEIDAKGLVMMPGGIDPHVHFNEPGRTTWEGLTSGSQALAKGGVTSFFDMPLNSTPPTNKAEAYHQKRKLADQKSVVNAYLWGGLTPNNLDHLDALAECGVIGFKAFMSNSGIDDFVAVDDDALYRGMKILAPHGMIVAVHAESDSMTSELAQKAIQAGRTSVQDYLQSRPIEAEVDAIERAIGLAEKTGCKLHIVHVSSANGVDLVTSARKRGIDVTCETCPHYLVLTDSDVERIGASAKCAPPIRSADEQSKLWGKLINGDIPIIASDHSPAPAELKQGDDFFAIWGGIAGCQTTLSLLLTAGYHQKRLTLQQIVALTSTNTAERFGLSSKGKIEVGMDADFTIIDLDQPYRLQAEDLAYRHKISPYVGMSLRGQIKQTWVGGQRVYG